MVGSSCFGAFWADLASLPEIQNWVCEGFSGPNGQYGRWSSGAVAVALCLVACHGWFWARLLPCPLFASNLLGTFWARFPPSPPGILVGEAHKLAFLRFQTVINMAKVHAIVTGPLV